jgi:hypothetical protein
MQTPMMHDPLYEQLLRSRIVLLGSEVNDEVANRLTMQLLVLAAEDDESDIQMYINSPGGSVTAGMAIYDTMNHIKPDVSTIGLGFVASMGQFLLSSGKRGKRFVLPSTRGLRPQPPPAPGGLVHQPPGARQREALAAPARGQQELPHRRHETEADRGHGRLDVVHRVVDGHARRDRTARRVDVHLDVGLVVLGRENQQLHGQPVGDLVVHLGAEQHDARAQQLLVQRVVRHRSLRIRAGQDRCREVHRSPMFHAVKNADRLRNVA